MIDRVFQVDCSLSEMNEHFPNAQKKINTYYCDALILKTTKITVKHVYHDRREKHENHEIFKTQFCNYKRVLLQSDPLSSTSDN